METGTSSWDFFWFLMSIYAFFAFLALLLAVIADLFRDRDLNGWRKALWAIFLVLVPFLSVLVYLIARGRSMAARGQRQSSERQEARAPYMRSATDTSLSDEISKARDLLHSGAITAEEYARIKERALTS
jgi:signal transduction histidine kinase